MGAEERLSDRLESEIGKWSEKIAKELDNIETFGSRGDQFLRNIKAYVKDSAYFLEKLDPVRSFEAIIWAWAWLEIGKEMGLLSKEYVRLER